MNVTMTCRDTCPLCRCRLRGIWVGSVRVNKHSLRTTTTSISIVTPCPECRTKPVDVRRWALTPDSQARVDAYRARKGWA